MLEKKALNALKRLGQLILVFGLVCLLFVFLWDLSVIQSYERFMAEQEKVWPRLIAMNEAILTQIPPLPGVTENEHTYMGGRPVHAAWLFLSYDLDESVKIRQVIENYDQILTAGGWGKKQISMDTLLYYRESACVEIRSGNVAISGSYDENSKNYTLIIWHGFRQLDFTPKPPSPVVMFLHEMGYSDYMPCPPE